MAMDKGAVPWHKFLWKHLGFPLQVSTPPKILSHLVTAATAGPWEAAVPRDSVSPPTYNFDGDDEVVKEVVSLICVTY